MKIPEATYNDLEVKAAAVYDMARGQLDTAATDTGYCRLLDVMLKSLRLESELRERTAAPAQIEFLNTQLQEVKATLAAHHAGNLDRGETPPDPRSRPTTWEQ